MFKYYGKLEVLGTGENNKYSKKTVSCVCECGNLCYPEMSGLISNNIKSCGKCSKTVFALCDTGTAIYYLGLTNQGDMFIFDVEDFDAISKHSWSLTVSKYLETVLVGDTKHTYLHRFITDCPKDKVVDHINGNTLDFRRDNLRVCTQTENNRNSTKRANTSSLYKGVCYSKQRSKFRARITVNGKDYHLGFFNNEEEAAKAYNLSALAYFGEFAKLNEVLPNE